MMKLYLIRHGETDWNKEGKLQGRTDIPLNEDGRAVAELTRDAMKNIEFQVAFTSPLIRARETAEIILKDRDIPIVNEERIIEVGFGEYEGSPKSEWDENMKKFFFHTECYVPSGDGETPEAVLVREKAFLEELFHNPQYQDSTILISTHGAALSGLLTIIKGNPISEYWAGGLHKNCGVSIVEVENGEAKIVQEAITFYQGK